MNKFAFSLILLGLFQATQNLSFVYAQNHSSQQLSNRSKPPSGGIPDHRKPAGTRGPCEETEFPLTPLLPDPNPDFFGLTVNEHPTFWFYVPYAAKRTGYGQFSLEEEDSGKLLWRSPFRLPRTPGLVKVSLPTQEKSLDDHKLYRWYFTIYCTPQGSFEPDYVFHTGLIQKVTHPEAKGLFNQLNLRERLNFYLEHKIWYDATVHLEDIRSSSRDWNHFLESIDLSDLQEAEITGSVLIDD